MLFICLISTYDWLWPKISRLTLELFVKLASLWLIEALEAALIKLALLRSEDLFLIRLPTTISFEPAGSYLRLSYWIANEWMKSCSASILLAWNLSGLLKSPSFIVFSIRLWNGCNKVLPLDIYDFDDFWCLAPMEPLCQLEAKELFLDGSISWDLSSLTLIMMSFSMRLLLDFRESIPRLCKYFYSAQIVAHFSM